MRRFVRASVLVVASLCAGLGIGIADDAKPVTAEQRLAKGKDLIDSICFWCHEPERIETKALDKEQWADLIRPMVYEGAPVTDEEFKMIVEYLAKNYGPEKQP